MNNWPNILTWIRIGMSPLLVVVFYLPLQDAIVNTLAAFVFLVASVTDFLDGFMARKYNWQSRFGAFLDPVADKVLVMTALLLLLSDERVPIIATLIIAYREICVSALREWMAGVGKFGRLNITIISKIKTGMQMAALTLLLYQAEIFGIDAMFWGEWLLWLSAALTLFSMAVYLRAAWPHLRENS